MVVPPQAEERRPMVEGHWDVQHLDARGLGPDGPVGLSLDIAFGAAAGTGRASMIGVVLEPGRRPVALVEQGIRIPLVTLADGGLSRLAGRSRFHWEVRSEGLWADHVVEDPLVHWSCGLEAFALAVDSPDELVRTGVGHRVPLGWELEFEAGGDAIELGEVSRTGAAVPGFRQPGRVHGIVMDERGEWPFDGVGIRTRWWGATPPSFVGAAPVPGGDAAEPSSNAIEVEVAGVGWSFQLTDDRLIVRNTA